MNFWEYLTERRAEVDNVDQLIARTQRNLSTSTLAVLAAVLLALFVVPMFSPKPIDPTVEKLLYVVVGALINVWATQNGFWFGRPRAAGIPDPTVTSTTQTTQTVTTPTGDVRATVQSVTSPGVISAPTPTEAPTTGG